MNTYSKSKWIKSLLVLSTLALVGMGSAKAYYGAFVSSTGYGSFGIYGLSWNWLTPGSAVNSAVAGARNSNGGYLNGYRYNWWANRGYEAGARGFNWNRTYVSFGWARGWSTRTSAVNFAYNQLGWNTNGLSYRSAYNY